VPGLVASIVGYSIFGWLEGWVPIFGAQPDLAFVHPLTLVYYAALGVICGLGGLLYSWSFYGTEHLFDRLSVPPWIKPAIGGLLVGLIGLKVHGALHTGYGWMQIDMTEQLKLLPLWIVLVLPFAKILATSLSIGSGGSGGIFGPGMVIGGALGAAFWRLGDGVLPQLPHTPAPFVIIGMMALFGGIAHAPLAVMLMVAEMTGNLSLLAPAMVAVALSTALVGDHTIYTSQLPSRADSPAHRIRFGFPLLSSLRVRDVMRAAPSTSDGNGLHAVPVESNGNGLLVSPDIPLDQALESLVEANGPATVVDDDAVVGTLSARDVVAGYRAAMARGVRRVGTLNPAVSMLEARVAPGAPLAGVALRDAKLPAGTLVVAISRHGEAIFPDASTRLESGDLASVLASPSAEEQVRDLFTAAKRVSTS
jgi:CIC family chloride channel protein